MKTLKGISLLVIILAFGISAMAQDRTAAESGSAVLPGGLPSVPAPKQEIVEVKIRVDFAWKEDMLPLTEEDIASFLTKLHQTASCRAIIMGGYEGGDSRPAVGPGDPAPQPSAGAPQSAVAETKIWYEMLGPSTMPARLDASWNPARTPGWKSARITMRFHQRLGAGLQGSLEARKNRGRVQRFIQDCLRSWLHNLDQSAGLSKRLKADVAARRDRYERRLGQLNSDEHLRQLDRMVREIEIEEFAKQARNKAMAEKIHEIRDRADAKVAADPILKELERIATIREEATKLAKQKRAQLATLHDRKMVSQAEVLEAEAKLKDAQVKALEARVRVAQRQEAIAVSAGGDLLTKLTNEAAMLSIDLAEMQARRHITGRKREESEAVKDQLEQSIEKCQQELKDAEPWRIISTPEPQLRPMGEKPRKAQG